MRNQTFSFRTPCSRLLPTHLTARSRGADNAWPCGQTCNDKSRTKTTTEEAVVDGGGDARMLEGDLWRQTVGGGWKESRNRDEWPVLVEQRRWPSLKWRHQQSRNGWCTGADWPRRPIRAAANGRAGRPVLHAWSQAGSAEKWRYKICWYPGGTGRAFPRTGPRGGGPQGAACPVAWSISRGVRMVWVLRYWKEGAQARPWRR
jgi:hypothetical protein